MTWTTPDLCDAFPHVSVLAPLFRDYGGKPAFHGRIVTVRCDDDNSRVRELAGTDGDGKVLVVDGGGSLRRALLGDRIAADAVAHGWEGVLIHGCVRDVEVLAQLPLGVFALAAHPMKTDKRGLGEVDVPVNFAGADVLPGQWLYADRNGVIISTRDLLGISQG